MQAHRPPHICAACACVTRDYYRLPIWVNKRKVIHRVLCADCWERKILQETREWVHSAIAKAYDEQRRERKMNRE